MPQANDHDRPLGSLLADLAQETTELVRREVALAKAELSEKVSQLGTNVALLAIGAALVLAGLLVLLQAIVAALSKVMEPWLASLIVGGVVALIGIGLIAKGRRDLAAENLMPRRTLETIREDAEVIREKL